MLTSALTATSHWQPFLSHPVWRDSFAWIENNASVAAEGIYELGHPGWFVNVHGYTTKPETECQWENHLKTIDLQYLIAGAEAIRVLRIDRLGEPTLFKAESDTQKFASPAEAGHLLTLLPGDFAIFLPGEAHCPKIAVGSGAPLRKLVVKIPAALLAAS